jgi:SAM-dependent methyltransferase
VSADFSALRFSPLPELTRYASIALLEHVGNDEPLRVVDVGCGTGRTLIEVARRRALAQCMGLDISDPNIHEARILATEAGVERNTEWAVADYLTARLQPSDVIFSEGVLHLLPVSADAIFHKLQHDLRMGGRLVIVLPYRGPVNTAIIGVRWLLRMIRCSPLDALLWGVARALYSSLSPAQLRERLEYMYLTPNNLDGRSWREAAGRYGLKLVEARPWPQTSIAKLRHRMLVFVRVA